MDHLRPFISLCMIVRDEEPSLARCLESFHGAYDELIIVDTGSRDRTVDIAEEFAAKVAHFDWCDDFGKAKNYACSLATAQWIIMPDGDEYLAPPGIGPRLPEMLRQMPDRLDKLLIEQRTLLGDHVLTVLVDRIFRNRPDLRWKYRIHEVIETPRDRTAMTGEFYLLHDNAGKRRHDMRISPEREHMYIRALRLDMEDHPDDPRPVFYLAETLCGAGRHMEALEAFGRYFHLSHGSEPARRAVAFRDAASAAGALGQDKRQRSLLFRSLEHDWRPAETYVAMADLALEHDNRDEAIHWLTVATTCEPLSDVHSLSSAYGPQIWQRLAGLHHEAGNKTQANRCSARARELRQHTQNQSPRRENRHKKRKKRSKKQR